MVCDLQQRAASKTLDDRLPLSRKGSQNAALALC